MNRRKFLTSSVAYAAAANVNPASLAAIPSSGVASAVSRMVALDAKPTSLRFDLAKTAIIVVDMQNDFGTKGGMFDRAGIDISQIQRAVPPTARVLAAGRQAGLPVIYLKMAFKPDLSDMGKADSPNGRVHQQIMHVGAAMRAPNGTDSRILIRDTWNTDIVNELKPESADTQIYKSRFSGFYETELDSKLKSLGARYLIFTGCTTSVCVESTIRDSMFRDYSPVLLEDCTAEPVGSNLPRSNHDASLFLIQLMFGWVSTSDHFLKALDFTHPQ